MFFDLFFRFEIFACFVYSMHLPTSPCTGTIAHTLFGKDHNHLNFARTVML